MSDAATRIINAALVQLGEDTVASVSAAPAPSRIVKILPHLQPAIDAVLVRYGWLCALEYATLQPSGDIAANWKWPVHYVAPEGALRLWEVARLGGFERGTEERAGQEARMIVRAMEGGPLNVSYVKRRAADGLDANVADAVAFELAARACIPIKGDATLAEKLRKAADDAVLKAMGTDGQDAKGDEAMFADRLAAIRASAA